MEFEMNTHDKLELPPLPQGEYRLSPDSLAPTLYDEEAMEAYARAAIEADRKQHDRMLAHEWIRPALGLSEDAPYRFDFYAQQIEGMKADRQRRGEPVGYIMPSAIKQLKAGGNAIVGGVSQGCDVPIYTAPQPAEPIVSDVEAIVRLLESREWAEHVATTPLGQRLETAVTVLVGADPQPSEPVEVPSDADAKHVQNFINCDGMGAVIVEGTQYSAVVRALLARYGPHAQPAKSSLSVSYDDKYDVLYVDCDSNEPTDAEEDDKGILYRRAISDGRLVGITIMNFMGPHAESRYGKGAP